MMASKQQFFAVDYPATKVFITNRRLENGDIWECARFYYDHKINKGIVKRAVMSFCKQMNKQFPTKIKPYDNTNIGQNH